MAQVKKAKSNKGAKQSNGGEAKKTSSSTRAASQKNAADLSEAQDRKRNNIGPSGQGTHRGRERNNRQTHASGRPDVSSVTGG